MSRKKRRNYQKKPIVNVQSQISQTPEPTIRKIQDKPIQDIQKSQSQTKDLIAKFKAVTGLESIIKEEKILDYNITQIFDMVSCPHRNGRHFIRINNYMYNSSMFFKNMADFYTKMPLYRYTANILPRNSNFTKTKDEFINKKYIAFCNKIEELNLGQELHRMLIKMFLEDAVFGYWLEEGSSSSIYYFPSRWCKITGIQNGMWAFSLRVDSVPVSELKCLPKEIAMLIKRYKNRKNVPLKDGLLPIPYEKSVCFKWNFHLPYIFPPFTAVVKSVLELADIKKLSRTKYELDVMNILAMKIPIDEKEQDHMLLSNDIVAPFVNLIKESVPDNLGVAVAPLDMEMLSLSKNQSVDKDIVEDAIGNYNSEIGVPDFGDSDTAAEMKRAIENASGVVFNIMNQISNGINLKMKLDGYSIFPSFWIKYEMLEITNFNKIEYQESLLKQAQAGVPVRLKWYASLNVSPPQFLGQSRLEDNIYRDIFENQFVPKTSYTSSSEDEGGRPNTPENQLTGSGSQTVENDGNNPENRNK